MPRTALKGIGRFLLGVATGIALSWAFGFAVILALEAIPALAQQWDDSLPLRVTIGLLFIAVIGFVAFVLWGRDRLLALGVLFAIPWLVASSWEGFVARESTEDGYPAVLGEPWKPSR